MGEAMALGLAKAGSRLRIANRTWDTALELADRVGGEAVRLLDLPATLADVDVLLTSTGAATPLIEADDVAPAMAARPERPLLIVDIAVPRDVDPAVGRIDGVTLLDMDDLRTFAAQGAQARQDEVTVVEQLLDGELERYLGATSAREVAPMIVALREQAEAVRAAELDRYRSRLQALDADQLEAVEALTKGLVAKLLHEPSVALKDAAGTAKGDRLVAALREIFALGDE
jgi:glutamyl-tRNA reductase